MPPRNETAPKAGKRKGAGEAETTSAKSKRTPSRGKVNGCDVPIAFLQRAFAGREGYISVTAIDPKSPNIETRSAPIGDIPSLANFIAENNGKRNLYWSVNRLRSALYKKAEKKDVATLDFLHVDLDPRDGESIDAERVRIKARIDRFEPMPNIIIDSGGGYACCWRLRDPPTVDGNYDEVEAYSKGLADALGGDNCHNVDRIMRLPGTVNLPTPKKIAKGRGVYEASLLYADADAYTLADFKPAASREQEPPLNSSIPLRIAALAERFPIARLIIDLIRRYRHRMRPKKPPIVKPGSIVEFLLNGNTLFVPPSEAGPDCHQDFEILSPERIDLIPPLADTSLLLSFPYQLVVLFWPHDRTLVATIAPHTACPPPLWFIFDCYYEARDRAKKT